MQLRLRRISVERFDLQQRDRSVYIIEGLPTSAEIYDLQQREIRVHKSRPCRYLWKGSICNKEIQQAYTFLTNPQHRAVASESNNRHNNHHHHKDPTRLQSTTNTPPHLSS